MEFFSTGFSKGGASPVKKFLPIFLCLLCSLSIICAQADINLPASLTVIGEDAFAGDSSISGLVKITKNVYRIQAGAFSNTNLTALELPANVAYIEDDIVSGSPATYVLVRNSDVSLSENALDGASVIISHADDAACQWAQTNGVEWYNIDMLLSHNGFYYALSDDGTVKLLFAKDSGSVASSMTVPTFISGAAVTEISEHAFSYCYGLKSVSVPDTIESIPEGSN